MSQEHLPIEPNLYVLKEYVLLRAHTDQDYL